LVWQRRTVAWPAAQNRPHRTLADSLTNLDISDGWCPIGFQPEGNIQIMKSFNLKPLLPLLAFALAGTLQAQLLNGNFETGNLSHWTTYTTSNGNLGSYYGLPNVISFDVVGAGTLSSAAQFQVGQPSFVGGSLQGGGIYQTFTASSAGQYFIHADIAAAVPAKDNLAAGLFTLRMDGVAINSVDLGFIAGGQTLRSTLEATTTLTPGAHQLSIEMTRPYLNGGGFANTPLEYLDNIQVTQVPEPSAMLLSSLGLISLLSATRKSKA